MEINAFGTSFDGLMNAQHWSHVAIAAHLSPREQSVCQQLFQGKTRQQIAMDLRISPRTVRQHLETIHGKLGVTNRVGLVLRIIQIRDGLDRHERLAGSDEVHRNGRQVPQRIDTEAATGRTGK